MKALTLAEMMTLAIQKGGRCLSSSYKNAAGVGPRQLFNIMIEVTIYRP